GARRLRVSAIRRLRTRLRERVSTVEVSLEEMDSVGLALPMEIWGRLRRGLEVPDSVTLEWHPQSRLSVIVRTILEACCDPTYQRADIEGAVACNGAAELHSATERVGAARLLRLG